jgi:hypothetical protein
VVGFEGSELARAAVSVAARGVGPRGRVVALQAVRVAAEFVDAPFEVEPRQQEHRRAERLFAELEGEQLATEVSAPAFLLPTRPSRPGSTSHACSARSPSV